MTSSAPASGAYADHNPPRITAQTLDGPAAEHTQPERNPSLPTTNRQRPAAVDAATLLPASGSTAATASTVQPQRSDLPADQFMPPGLSFPGDDTVTLRTVGRTQATRPSPGMASIRLAHDGDHDRHTCGARLIQGQRS